ncbi:hypothetical protein GDO78_006229 [Eleutherodactylus coqui]|uniref:Max dimerization protein 3 n=1 Tax=Eleutherodactylus coqui TaxID=57060 RepID=A0A8J6FMQ4_ELECQ|nr:hypothetical protein GDO78_006229 [Eleutherodactylus coqui]
MEPLPTNLQVLLQAAEYVERREREAEHGYASILPCDAATPGRRKRQRTTSNPDSVRSVHNELEKHRKTISNPLQKLEDQELRAKNLKEKLRTEQQRLRQRLKQLLPSSSTERIRADSLDSSTLSSERSDSDQEDLEVDVEGVILGANEGDLFVSFSAGMEHSYSTPAHAWL